MRRVVLVLGLLLAGCAAHDVQIAAPSPACLSIMEQQRESSTSEDRWWRSFIASEVCKP